MAVSRAAIERHLIGLVSFAAPFLGCAAIVRWALGWTPQSSWLAGIAMSTTSVAVVYAVMLEFGLNTTEYGKVVLAIARPPELGEEVETRAVVENSVGTMTT